MGWIGIGSLKCNVSQKGFLFVNRKCGFWQALEGIWAQTDRAAQDNLAGCTCQGRRQAPPTVFPTH
jgi:hypothetical protein